ncbi:pyridoxamine 5'-phosphate oxidase family protein [Ruania halotolerans]|uniref:pyridoxamine 5'-phosphate oxidase family protein n=1 Tax=Ruania halotolerans TaxID=2897773 RepID=UPI001E429C9F|nr:pyridoxamine 5'-phosphate oxidase family protein [Ruania halotolerans]UFU08187.1 pyridoxamine 5'-phosphate oxidase family protein [Ruania halotolerans]
MTEDQRAPTRVLNEAECWSLIEDAPYGRVAAAAGDEIDIFPINHAVLGGDIVFRTAPGTKLVELTIRHRVAFEVDGYDDSHAWSVVVKGQAVELERSAEIAELEQLSIRPWAPEEKARWVRIDVSDVQGRRFERPTVGSER